MFKYSMVIKWSREDNLFLVSIPEFTGQQWRTHGFTYQEAVRNGIEVMEALAATYEVCGDVLPEVD